MVRRPIRTPFHPTADGEMDNHQTTADPDDGWHYRTELASAGGLDLLPRLNRSESQFGGGLHADSRPLGTGVDLGLETRPPLAVDPPDEDYAPVNPEFSSASQPNNSIHLPPSNDLRYEPGRTGHQ